jgi:xanthine dehydrogenase accessory factor
VSTNPLPDLFEELVRRRARGERMVLATVVRVQGSTPREAGARMLLLADGSICGTVGGGVREADVIAAARELLVRGGSRLLGVDFQDGLAGGDGPVCGGTMEVYMERIDPVRRVVIAGAGHVAYFLHRALALLEYRTVVVDPRPEWASEERFPGAALVHQPFPDGIAGLDIAATDAVVLVTPGHQHDRESLRRALATPAGYVGMIGSKVKVATVFKALHEEGVEERELARVHAPIGLDLGAETPAEIAVAIAAEIVAVLHGREIGLSAGRHGAVL